jgi:UDP-N-acetyl-D-glucosamine/UDP-N-acetyl-D-galactosamine dehydrogenase
MHEYGLKVDNEISSSEYDAIIVAVAHNQFKAMNISDLRKVCKANHVIYDLKYVFPESEVDMRF